MLEYVFIYYEDYKVFITLRTARAKSDPFNRRSLSNIEHGAHLLYKLAMKRAGSKCAPSLESTIVTFIKSIVNEEVFLTKCLIL